MPFCPREHEVVSAVRDGRISPDLSDHIRSCVDCAHTARLVGALHGLAAATPGKVDGNTARLLWILSEQRRRQSAGKRLTRLQRAAAVVVCLASFAWVGLTGHLDDIAVMPGSSASLAIVVIAVMTLVFGVWSSTEGMSAGERRL